ncbi:MAG: TlyA family RNA methyltransferase [Clostridia bacterium]|nr:TlyA family RNA methyltransferase [Clostridia bacterium]
MRLDVFLFDKGLAKSRTEAKNLIQSSSVTVDGRVVTKPSFDIEETVSDVQVNTDMIKYASRAGFKLEAALSAFDISVRSKKALDIGASSGGFTDCLLQNGALHVIALDSGKDQLVDFLRRDGRVTVIENYNARYLRASDLQYIPDIIVMDVSFISATYIIQPIFDCLASGGDFICLIKPQFEVGKFGLSKGGIVKNDKLRKEAVGKVLDFARAVGFCAMGVIESPIAGGDGNIEFLAHFIKEESSDEKDYTCP